MNSPRRLVWCCFMGLLLFLWRQPSLAQSHTTVHIIQNAPNPSKQVDSVFTKYFVEINAKIKENQSLNSEERGFLLLASFMAGSTFYTVQCYTPITIEAYQLASCKKWYKINQNRISWLDLKRGSKILHSTTVAESEQKEVELESLRIK